MRRISWTAREKKALKRGGDLKRVELEGLALPSPVPDDELLALDEALDRLAAVDTRAVEMVKLCFFVGLTQEEEAALDLEVSLSTAERIWDLPARGYCARWRKEKTGTLSKRRTRLKCVKEYGGGGGS